ncbi:MAG: HAD-IA family hydrolase [Deltaproteobacteria bacterium]|nr:HAD-IA family hydrolase [Deltaproteobacteria bacterium]
MAAQDESTKQVPPVVEQKIQVILLDVMDTLVRDPFFSHMPHFHGQSMESLAREMDRDAWFAFEKGELTQAEYQERYFRDGRKVDLDGVIQCMKTGYVFLDGIEALLEELSCVEIKVYALSNYPIWWKFIEERLQLSRFLEWRFMSCRLGKRKPDPALFQAVLDALDVSAAHCLFVDDSKVNCESARTQGMNAVQFRGAAHLKEIFRTHNVLPGPAG